MLWLVAVGWGFNFVSAYTGFPQVIGMVVAVGVAAFVGIDPLGVIWPARVGSPLTVPDAALTVNRAASRI